MLRLVIPLALVAAVLFAAAASPAHRASPVSCPHGARTLATVCR